MDNQIKKTFSLKYFFPPLGQRIIKTSIAVAICLLISYIRGTVGSSISAEAPITAVICLQPYLRDSKKFALDRFTGTLIGAFVGLIFLGVFYTSPKLFSGTLFLYLLIALGTGISLYASLLFKVPDTASLAAIVYLCIVISFPDIEDPIGQFFLRILDVFIGTAAAILVNVIHLPREKKDNKVFFIKAKDLTKSRSVPVSRTVLYRLNHLQEEGAKICIELEHAPAFFLLQMNQIKLNIPMIVMDGAAIFDFTEGEYLHTVPLKTDTYDTFTGYLNSRKIGYYIYTIQNNQVCIFHHGEINENDREIYRKMKRSPYRSYQEGENYSKENVVYLKVISKRDEIERLYKELTDLPEGKDRRIVVRPQFDSEELLGLYIYSSRATTENAEEYLMNKLKKEDKHFESVHVQAENKNDPEREALRLLHNIGKEYMPVQLFMKQ